MPKRTDIHKIMIIGSGPIVIGQACEFDYSGSQALKVLKKEGFHVVLVNSNPATIMTDPELADATYVEPLIPEVLERVIAREKPDVLLPTLGGQTALNLAVALSERGVLERYNVELIGAKLPAIQKAEDRRLFKKTMQDIGLDLPKSGYAKSLAEAEEIARQIGFPLIIRASFTLGGLGSAHVFSRDEFLEAANAGLDASPIHEILIEESIVGWKEFELEVMRDTADNCVVICAIENLDPMGVHTGDSITVAPAQTLTDKEYQRMREAAFACIRAIGVETGGSNVQFAVNPEDGRMVIIEMNPRVSRSSALASKATGFPIAKLAALLAVGYRLDEIPNDITKKTLASFEPTIDYVVTKIPRFAFEKFTGADQTLTTSMKSVGEVMALGRTFKESLQKAVRSLETGHPGLGPDPKRDLQVEQAKNDPAKREALLQEYRAKLITPTSERLYVLRAARKLGASLEEIAQWTRIDPWFLRQIDEILNMEERLAKEGRKKLSSDLLHDAKRMGFSDKQIGLFTKMSEKEARKARQKAKIHPTYKAVDTCAAEFPAYTPYFYSTYESEDEVRPSSRKKVMILGGGPNRIGQGIEFDYCCVHAALALKEEGFETIMVNCNPETVSTDYDTSDVLFFEPLTTEDVLNIAERLNPLGVIVQFGGQTPLNLADSLKAAGVKILGTSADSIDLAEDRERFGRLLDKLKIPQAPNGTAVNVTGALQVAKRIGYPVMVRPSYVLGGRAMEVVYDQASLTDYIQRAAEVSPEKPILIDQFLDNAMEVDVDALSDGREVFIGGIMEHIEQAGIHSGDSACVLPPKTLSESVLSRIREYTTRLALALKVQGLINLQFAVREDVVYVLEVNPRASRTVPFVCKASGLPLAKYAAKIMLGKKLKDFALPKKPSWKHVAVKEAVLPWSRFPGSDAVLGPEMRSTGEVMGIDRDFGRAFAKSQAAAGSQLPSGGTLLLSLRDQDKKEALSLVREFSKLNFQLMATHKTAEFLRSSGLEVKDVAKLSEGRPHVVDVIKNKQVVLVVNTPSGKGARSDGYAIRRAALSYNVPILTTLAAVRAALEGIQSQKKDAWDVRSLQEYYAGASKAEKPVTVH